MFFSLCALSLPLFCSGWCKFLKIYILQGNAATRFGCSKIFNKTVLSPIVRRMCQWKNFENWSTFGKDVDKSLVARFMYHHVYKQIVSLTTNKFELDKFSMCRILVVSINRMKHARKQQFFLVSSAVDKTCLLWRVLLYMTFTSDSCRL